MVPSNEVASTFTILTPKTSGKKRITAKFRSRELNDVDGMVNIEVNEDYDDNNNIERNYLFNDDNSNNNTNIDDNSINRDNDINMNRINRMY